uniref:LRAT domain-containing protein n=1 Tax=Plectus sambesii TaxID=2011161 RepID=A0A914WDV0_9BILA
MAFMLVVISIAICCATTLARCDHDQCERAFLSKWANTSVKMEYEKLIESLVVGDLIECKTMENSKFINVLGYEMYHWKLVTQINEGDVYVHHVIGQNLNEMSVKKERLVATVRNYEKCRRNNRMDIQWTSRDPTEMLKCVNCMAGQWKYNLLSRNCEHFVNLCRYWKFESSQISKLSAPEKVLVVASLTAMSASSMSVVASSKVSGMAKGAYTSALNWNGGQPKSQFAKSLADFVSVAQANCIVS